MAPPRRGARAEWLAAGTYDRSVGFSLFTLQITHKIAPDTDAERDHILSTLTSSAPAVSVTMLEDFATGYHARNGGGDAIETDGDLPVVDLRAVTVDATAVNETAVPVPAPKRRRAGAPEKRVLRPSPTVFGAVVVMLRAVTPLVVYVGAVLGWSGLGDVLLIDDNARSLSDSEIEAESTLYLAVAIVFLVYQGGLGLLVLFGSDIARIVVMLGAVGSIAVSAVAHFQDGQEISLATNLVSLSLDILILTALSSSRARDFAHRRRAPQAHPTLTAT
ncbi:LssY C-terminal domain-containing protein [Herbiconiux sp. L3-i23]|uniref:LssY C-terminal domain-containing protein n=1 Tax=Herbiconiux sp. L3-i23 TaxID=2905871 RepID=UPI00204C6A23|nr:LssY C-terminal domain-containing protein [Herbiconiux sp. L3-i23]BDI23023.1 hypothetical protein L3i23_17990 [Herbiconiux sp. L3-i23]